MGTNKTFHTLESCIEAAKQKGGLCLSIEYKDTTTKMLWKCYVDSHPTWEAIFSSVLMGTWCPYCAGHIKCTLQDCIDFAELKRGKCLSLEYKNANEKMLWQCEFNHQWKTTFCSIKGGTWCPYCAGNARLTIEHCKRAAIKRGGECLSDEYINNVSPLTWKCSFGHIWITPFTKIRDAKHWCPTCALCKRSSRQEIEIYNYVLKIFPDALNGINGLLINKKMSFDIYIPLLKKAIEFDGEYWHSFPNVKNRDEIKNKLCREAGIELLRIQEEVFKKDSGAVFQKILLFLDA